MMQIDKNKLPILMKNGMVHWVEEETWRNLGSMVNEQTAHGFIKIVELDIQINTADISEIFGIKEYEEFCKVKQGMWKCVYQNWHNKGKKECECHQDALRSIRARQENDRRQEEMKKMTDEERDINIEKLKKAKEEWALSGSEFYIAMYTGKTDLRMRRSTITEYEKVHGKVNPDIINKIKIDEEN